MADNLSSGNYKNNGMGGWWSSEMNGKKSCWGYTNNDAQTKHLLSRYTDNEKRWLVTTADEERCKDTEFILRLKRRWDKQYPEKNRVSK